MAGRNGRRSGKRWWVFLSVLLAIAAGILTAAVQGGRASSPRTVDLMDASWTPRATPSESDAADSTPAPEPVPPAVAATDGPSALGETPATDIAPAPESDVADPATLPRKEKDYYREFQQLARENPQALSAIAVDVLLGDGPDCEKVALLRCFDDSSFPETSKLFIFTLQNLPDRSSAAGESVPSFLVRTLGERCANDPEARAVLEAAIWEGSRSMSPSLRRRAAARLAAGAGEEELIRLSALLEGERDEDLLRGVAQSLGGNPNREAVQRVFGGFSWGFDTSLGAREERPGSDEQGE